MAFDGMGVELAEECVHLTGVVDVGFGVVEVEVARVDLEVARAMCDL